MNNVALKLNISKIACCCYSIISWSVINHKQTWQGIFISHKKEIYQESARVWIILRTAVYTYIQTWPEPLFRSLQVWLRLRAFDAQPPSEKLYSWRRFPHTIDSDRNRRTWRYSDVIIGRPIRALQNSFGQMCEIRLNKWTHFYESPCTSDCMHAQCAIRMVWYRRERDYNTSPL